MDILSLVMFFLSTIAVFVLAIIWIVRASLHKKSKGLVISFFITLGVSILSVFIFIGTVFIEGGSEGVRISVTETDKSVVAQDDVDIKQKAKKIEFAQLKKNPDRYKGELVVYEGLILQIMESGNKTIMRVSVTKDDYGYGYDDVIFVEYAGLTEFVEDDVVTVYGEVKGSKQYTSIINATITLPNIQANIIE